MDTQDTEAVALLKQAVALLTAMQKDIADIAKLARRLEREKRDRDDQFRKVPIPRL